MTTHRLGWLIPAGLIFLSLVPVVAAVLRVADLALFASTPATARFHGAPWPVIVHVTGASLFLILGSLQLVPGLRARSWHRRAGKVAVVAGGLAALAGLWMTHNFPPEPANPDLLFGFRITAGVAWLVFLALAVSAIRAGDVLRHRAFMLRALAIGFGAGTTVFTFGLWYLVTGRDSPEVSALTQAAAWAINLAVAEYAIARARPRRAALTA